MAFGHGKLILFGEHGVVYGRPAIAAALAQGAQAVTEAAPSARLEVEPWGVAFDADAVQADAQHEMLRQAFRALLQGYAAMHAGQPSFRVRARLSLPGSAGLGGSAALSVAIVRALDAGLGIERDDTAVARHALEAERVFHGNPSGIDSALAASGGVALFRKNAPLERLALGSKLTLVVGHSGQPGSTRETVASVGRQQARDPERLRAIFDDMEAIVMEGKLALARGELPRLGRLMIDNQELLQDLGLSTPRLDAMCSAAQSAGALGSKLTGGGGGGCMIALCADVQAAEAVRVALAASGRQAFTTEVGG